jgi:hypothetical protein
VKGLLEFSAPTEKHKYPLPITYVTIVYFYWKYKYFFYFGEGELGLNSIFFFFEIVSQKHSPGCPGTHNPPASASQVLGLQAGTTMLAKVYVF